jgi:FkbM family methyltransferase
MTVTLREMVEQPVVEPPVYEPEVADVIRRFLSPGDCAVDVGASIGHHTCLMSRMVGEEGLVFAFEPHGESFKLLVESVNVNKLNNVAMFQTALWSRDLPEMELWSVPEMGYSSFLRYENATGSEKVACRSLDSFLINDHPRLIKLDCEGSETNVLAGADRILRKGVDCVVVEFNYWVFRETNLSDLMIRQYMKSLGYDLFIIGVKVPYPVKLEPAVSITLEGGHHINVMFSTEEKVRARWR